MSAEAEQGGNCPDDVESVEEEETGQEVTDKIPSVLAALQNQRSIELLATLPAPVKRRIKALKKLQATATDIEAKFFQEVHSLECKYHKFYVPLYEKRGKIVNGAYEPTEEEAQWPSDDENELSEAIKNKVQLEEKKEEKKEEEKDVDVKGIPDFWLTIFRNVNMLSEMVQPHDVPILKHLTDIKTTCKEDPMSFTLEFHFSPNEYFTDAVLIKEYEMKCVPEEDDPFSFEGPEIFKCTGCTINWNKGKNVTLKTVKKKQKHKSRGVVRTVTKTIQNDSFFNFFNPPAMPDTKEEDVDEDLRNLLTADFEIGHYIRERIVPRAVLYFTGEDLEDEDYDEDDEEDDDDDDGDSEGDGVNKDANCKQQ